MGAAVGPNILGEREMKMPQYSREPKLTGFIFTKFQSSAKGSARKEKLAAEAITTLGPIICCLHFNWRLYFKIKKNTQKNIQRPSLLLGVKVEEENIDQVGHQLMHTFVHSKLDITIFSSLS